MRTRTIDDAEVSAIGPGGGAAPADRPARPGWADGVPLGAPEGPLVVRVVDPATGACLTSLTQHGEPEVA